MLICNYATALSSLQNLHAMLSFYICAIIKINLIKVFKIYPNITFTIIYSNKMHDQIKIQTRIFSVMH